MEERFEQLRQAISQDLDKKLDEKLSVRFNEASRQLREDLSKDIDKKLDDKFAVAEKRLSDQFQIHAEDVRQIAKTTAESYGGVLEGIDRKLTDLSTKWDTTIGDHGRALKHQGKRITTLERRSRATRRVLES